MNIGWKVKQTYNKWWHLGFDRHFDIQPIRVVYGGAWVFGAFIISARHLGMEGSGTLLMMSAAADILVMTAVGLGVLYGPKILIRGLKNLRFLVEVKKSGGTEKKLETIVITDKPR